MKYQCINVIVFCFLLIRCSDGNLNSREKSTDSDSTEKNAEAIPVIATTEMTIMPVHSFPEGYLGDTIIPVFPEVKVILGEMKDSIEVTYQFDALYPQAKNFKQTYYNDDIKKFVNDYFEQYRIEKGESFGGFHISASLIASDFVSFENKYAGVLFTEQSYFDGAAHFNHGYLSYHQDFYRGKRIYLTDILIFKPGEAQKFCDAFNPDPTTTINETMLEGGDFSDERPFMTYYGELYLYFSDYEKGPSMTRVIIPYSKFKGYVDPEYRYLFEHE